MKGYLILISIFFLSQTLIGQEGSLAHVILENGHKLVGEVIEYKPDSHVVLKIESGAEITFSMDKVKEFMMDETDHEPAYNIVSGKIYNRTSFSYLTGQSGEGYDFIHSILYQFDGRLAAGIQGGIANYYGQGGYNIFPVGGSIRFFIKEARASPYLALDGGFAFSKVDRDQGQQNSDGGLYINPYIGYRFSDGDLMVDVFTGISIQKSRYEYVVWESTRIDEITFKRLKIGMGFTF